MATQTPEREGIRRREEGEGLEHPLLLAALMARRREEVGVH